MNLETPDQHSVLRTFFLRQVPGDPFFSWHTIILMSAPVSYRSVIRRHGVADEGHVYGCAFGEITREVI